MGSRGFDFAPQVAELQHTLIMSEQVHVLEEDCVPWRNVTLSIMRTPIAVWTPTAPAGDPRPDDAATAEAAAAGQYATPSLTALQPWRHMRQA